MRTLTLRLYGCKSVRWFLRSTIATALLVPGSASSCSLFSSPDRLAFVLLLNERGVRPVPEGSLWLQVFHSFHPVFRFSGTLQENQRSFLLQTQLDWGQAPRNSSCGVVLSETLDSTVPLLRHGSRSRVPVVAAWLPRHCFLVQLVLVWFFPVVRLLFRGRIGVVLVSWFRVPRCPGRGAAPVPVVRLPDSESQSAVPGPVHVEKLFVLRCCVNTFYLPLRKIEGVLQKNVLPPYTNCSNFSPAAVLHG